MDYQPQNQTVEISPVTGKPKKKYNYTRKTGRPPETIESAIEKGKLPPNWKTIILQKCLQGLSDVEIRRDLCLLGGRGVKTIEAIWNELQVREYEFARTIKIGRVFCEAWWIEKSRKGLRSKYFKEALWFMNMKNRFPDHWRDKYEIDHGVTDETFEKYRELTADQIQSRLASLVPNTPRLTNTRN